MTPQGGHRFGKTKLSEEIKKLSRFCMTLLFLKARSGTSLEMEQSDVPEIFDRRRRRALLNRADPNAFLWQYMADVLTEQLAMVSRQFESALFIGPLAYHAHTILAGRKTQGQYAALNEISAGVLNCPLIEEDRIPFAPESYDLIISAGTFDSINDLPGAMVQMRRTLKPDGLFLCIMFGSGTLATFRSVLMRADGDRARPHIHPQIDLRTAADLLSRTGFALPVADVDILQVLYSDWRTLVRDIRDTGTGNAFAGPRSFAGKAWINDIDEEWAKLKLDKNNVSEQFVFLNLSGWSPSPNQQKPARRGSGTVSLADALARKTD
jgi:NADH dehydrogenase [ubiquinone] 1 alpha subcomplex assembly factor 5